MLKVQCFSGYKVNERPVAFSLMDRSYQVEEILDRWYGERATYFKVRADDQNIYLLKYDENQDGWELVFYQNPRKLKAILSPPGESQLIPLLPAQGLAPNKFTRLN